MMRAAEASPAIMSQYLRIASSRFSIVSSSAADLALISSLICRSITRALPVPTRAPVPRARLRYGKCGERRRVPAPISTKRRRVLCWAPSPIMLMPGLRGLNMANALSSNSESGAFRFVRAGSTGFSVLFLIVFFWATWILYTKPLAIDFLSYWAASKLVLSGHVPSVYNLTAHNDVELLVAPIGGLLPFAYPPP